MSKKVHGTGKVVMVNGAAGVKFDTGVVWYPDQDLEEFEGDIVKVTIERIKEGAGRQIGFNVPVKPKRTTRRRRTA